MLQLFQKNQHIRRQLMLLKLTRFLGGERFLFNLGRFLYHLKIIELSSIPTQGGCIVGFNHVSDIADGLIYLFVHKYRPDLILISRNIWNSRINGVFTAIGSDFTGEQLLERDMRQSLNSINLIKAHQLLIKGNCLMLSPEGDRSWDGRLHTPFVPGTAWLALHTGVPFIPIVSKGGYDIQPLWQSEKIRLTGRIRIVVGQSLLLTEKPLEQISTAQVQEANRKLEEAMKEILE